MSNHPNFQNAQFAGQFNFKEPKKMDSPESLKVQHGGDHYKGLGIEPAQYCHANGIPFLEGSAIKYITRHRANGKAEDVKKAIHFLQMVLDLEYDIQVSVSYGTEPVKTSKIER